MGVATRNLTMFSFMVVGIPKPKIKMDNMKGFSPAQAEEKHIYDERFFPAQAEENDER